MCLSSYEKACVRSWSLTASRKIAEKANGKVDCDKILEDAKKISAFFEDKEGAVVSLVVDNKKGDVK